MRVRVLIPTQTLELVDERARLVKTYRVSTSAYGVGEKNGSFKTPRGRHIIRAKIGGSAPPYAVFVERRPTGEIYSAEMAARFPERDWILTRILWLSGCEPGFNKLGDVDTMRRMIYIHGSPDTAIMGEPGSRGCVRMHTADILDVFDRVTPGTPVDILETV
jgi:lipoprotein-anchoring transpeptidase ErfK/SrfK